MNRITINGKTITCSGTNVVISNGKVIVNGKTIQECNSGDIKVTIEGDVNKIDCDGSVEVHAIQEVLIVVAVVKSVEMSKEI